MINGSFGTRMKMMALAGAVLLLAGACNVKKKGSLTVTATYKNLDKLTMMEGPVTKAFLMEVPTGKDQAPIILDSVKLTGNNGHFTVSGAARAQDVYELVFGNNNLAVPIVNDVPEIKVDVDLGKKDEFYDVTGSEASTQLKDLITLFGKKNFAVEGAMRELDSLQRIKAPDTVLLAATAKKNAAIQDLNTYLKQFLNTSNNSTVSTLALGWASYSFNKSDFEAAMGDLLKRFPNNAMLQSLKQNYDQQMAQMANQPQSGDSWVGKDAPELTLPDVNGHDVSISSYKGKYLLVDFWASWCNPCREENPNVVKAYQEFKDKNFAILGVSLDKEKDAWLQAIKEDKLEWKHVSDLKFWQSKAVEVFKFDGIPFNVLIDPQGKIIAEKLRGDDLENKLREVLK